MAGVRSEHPPVRELSAMGLATAVTAAAVLLLAPAPSAAAGAALSLPAAVRLALEHSPMLLQAEAQGAAAQQLKREAKGLRLPAISVRAAALRTDSPADAFGLQLMQERFSFPEFTQSDPNHPPPINNFATEFEATWPIFTGGRVMAGIHQAERLAEAAEDASSHVRSAIALATATAYMDALLADRSAELARKARDTTARHVEQAQAFFDAGMIVESDLLMARVQLARMEENVIAAENSTRLARAGLNRVMGVDQGEGFDLEPTLPTAVPAPATLDSAFAWAQRNRFDTRAMAAGVAAADEGIGRASGEYWPELALVGKYSLNDDQPFGSDGESFAVMAVARWNVWNWGQTRARVAASRSQHVAATQAQRAQRDAVAFEVRQAWQGAEEARLRSAVTAQAIGQAVRALAILEERFGQGVSRVTDLLDAETQLDEARLRDLHSQFDLQRAVRTLNFAVGLPPVPEVLP